MRRLGASWVEVCCEADHLSACDLLITLGSAQAPATALPPGCRHSHWPLAEQASDADIEARVSGLLGGMRLLAQLDHSGPPRETDPAGS